MSVDIEVTLETWRQPLSRSVVESSQGAKVD